MKHALSIVLVNVILACTLTACEDSAQEKLAKQELERRDKEVQRMNAMRKAEDEAYAKLLGKSASSAPKEVK